MKNIFRKLKKKNRRSFLGNCFLTVMNDKRFFVLRNISSFILDAYYKITNRKDIFWDVDIGTCTACNLRCPYCPNSKFDRGLLENMKKMKIELFFKIIDELAELEWVGSVALDFYNEPLLDDRLVELVRYIRGKLPKGRIAIFSNGKFLSLGMYKELLSAGANHFCVTEHLDNMSKVNIEEIINYRNKRGENNVLFGAYKKRKLIYNRGGLVELDPKTSNKPTRCIWTSHWIGIDFEGNVLMCCNDYSRAHKAGNVNEEKLVDIWNKPYYKNFRRDIRKGIFKLEMCQKCSIGYLNAKTC